MSYTTSSPQRKETGITDVPPPPAPPGDVPTSHPPAIWFFFWGEFAERSSYYGMRTILSLYLAQVLLLSATKAGLIFFAFKMACYFLPLVGGIIADRWLGRYWTIVGFCVPYVAGHFILGIPNFTALALALTLLACGSGVIKPNISTLMGHTYDQLRPGQETLRMAAFNWFYFSVNVGALISMFCLPIVRDQYILAHLTPEARAEANEKVLQGQQVTDFASQELLESAYAVAFAFPAGLMVLSLAVFAAGKPFYVLEKPERHILTPEERRLRRQTLFRLLGIFALVTLFWFGYEHNDNLWVFFARDYVNLRIPYTSIVAAPDQLQWLNSAFVLILIPVFNAVFGWLDPHIKIFTPMRKVLAGFVLTAVAIGIMSLAGFLAQGHTEEIMQGEKLVERSMVKLSIFWPAAAYIVLTFGEVLLYGTLLELAYSAAPKSMKGFVTGCFLATNGLGNLLNMGWTRLYGGSLTDAAADRGRLLPGEFFGITALVVLAAAIAFLFIGRQFQRKQAEAQAAGLT